VFKFDPVEYLSQVLVKLRASTSRMTRRISAPADDGFFRVDTLGEIEHRAVVVHIDRHLLTRLRMQHRECGAHRDGIVAFISCAEERANDALLGVCAAEVVVEDGEERCWVDGDRRSPAESTLC
jgi:hypothetical protein